MTDAEWANIRFFEPREFDSKDLPGSGRGMDYGFVRRLDSLRSIWGQPISVHSGYRTKEHNEAVGGKPNSAHLRGLAADLEAADLKSAIRLAIVAARVGFTRIGVDLKGGFIHVDSDLSLPQYVTWWYHEGELNV